MTDALKELLAKVEAGSCENDGSMHRSFGDNWTHCFDAYHGSLDAAKALHEAVLVGWTVRLNAFTPHGKSAPYVHVFKMRMKQSDPTISANSSGYQGDNPARAWLIAIIKALIAIEASE
tara:strand:- start:1398 stop:1754 length:357 start_codon:yes stop_codon:yes gene_type:complete